MSWQGPRFVRVTNAPDAEDFRKRLQSRATAIAEDLDKGQALVMEWHSPSGEVFQIRNLGNYSNSSDMVLLVCEDKNGEECQVVAQTYGLQIVLRVVSVPGEERKPIGFTFQEPPEGED